MVRSACVPSRNDYAELSFGKDDELQHQQHKRSATQATIEMKMMESAKFCSMSLVTVSGVPRNRRVIHFYYDIVCPWAYMASTRIEKIAALSDAAIVWTPVLLGGIYKLTQAPQGKHGSASDLYVPNKRDISSQDLLNTADRFNIPLSWHPQHPLRSINAGRLLHSLPMAQRRTMTHALYKAYWVDNVNVTDPQVLLSIARSHGVTPMNMPLDEAVFSHPTLVEALTQATATAVEQGAPGVPCCYLPETVFGIPRLFWGGDRLHKVIWALTGIPALPQRVMELQPHRCPTGLPLTARKAKLTMFWDFSSPWAFLGWSQHQRIQMEAGPLLEIEHVPILLGALFKDIGTPNQPMLAMSDQKRAYFTRDLSDWQEFWNSRSMPDGSNPRQVNLNWPSEFPIRSVLPLRVALLEPKVIDTIFRAAWEKDIRVADPQVLAELLTSAGFDGAKLVSQAQQDPALKQKLFDSNKRALEVGLCGVPSYYAKMDGDNDGLLVWGQDRVDVVMDYLAGWRRGDVQGGGSKL